MAGDRVTVREAARRLGVEDDAIRERIQRGTLKHDEDPDGRIYVYLDPDLDPSSVASGDASHDAYLMSLMDQVSYLRSVLREERDARRRADTIIAQLTQANAALAQRVPELQTPQSREVAAQGAAEDAARELGQGGTGDPHGSTRPRDTAEFPVRGSLSRPWWKRVFGG
jgi:hypothetical protein